MFDKTLKENADETFQMAEKALEKMIDGEVTYQNFRNYVINLHNSYELYFKYRLLENDVYTLFQYPNYDKFVLKQKKFFKDKKELVEYMKDSKATLPNTVSFTDSIERLESLDTKGEFNKRFQNKLGELHKLRNKLTHFEYKLGDEEFGTVNELFIKYSKNYDERYRWGCLPGEKVVDIKEFEEKIKNKELKQLILEAEFNQNLLKKIESYRDWTSFMFGCKSVAKDIVSNCEEFSGDDIKKIRKRLEILKYAELIEFTEEIIEMEEGNFTTIINVEVKNKK
ncbi:MULTISPECIES: hypothetical protein [Psychrilyobacter]|uniref:Swt1-like HEPN domain-containing protein n=1 Tax=Psychrilyobacter piezotolerans TaxID=2293438 RepID=A0ABX9KFA4_9FUSO|nr:MULTISPECIES: hypothetical protein [Psychrilyobacter]MCS5422332.1 hypothetical protein [Psychrilyobacter sp. S5]NDI78721.1 hypothetical protein [Psychrilyobacter piezotolerans]RDE59896.1 hypothetical protein DV867_12075 [Psychrilyobacter sp. S5]REI40177.1 hypothetical protein DYH56_12075 [Psychrilyobacter piezotolerans]